MYSNYLFVDAYSERHLRKIKKTIKKRKESPVYYVIELSTVTGRLEFYESKLYIQGYYDKFDPFIVGLAQSRGNAEQIVEGIIMQCLSMQGDLDFEAFFAKLQNKGRRKRQKEKLVVIKGETIRQEGSETCLQS